MKWFIYLLEHVLACPLKGWQNGALKCLTVSYLNGSLKCTCCRCTNSINNTLFEDKKKPVVIVKLCLLRTCRAYFSRILTSFAKIQCSLLLYRIKFMTAFENYSYLESNQKLQLHVFYHIPVIWYQPDQRQKQINQTLPYFSQFLQHYPSIQYLLQLVSKERERKPVRRICITNLLQLTCAIYWKL